MREQIPSILALSNYDFVCLFEDASCDTESSPDTKVISVTQTVVNRALTEGLQSHTLHSAVTKAVHGCVAETKSLEAVATIMFIVSSLILHLAIFIKHEVEKGSLDKAEMEKRFNMLTKKVDEKKIMIEEKIPTKNYSA